MEKDCSVCLIKNVKVGKHYGAVTCYSCRAFFRRSQDRKRPLRCKLSNSCEIGPDIGKSCPKCRYEKCLRVGMQPHLVLNEQEKNERFRSSRIKKALLNPTPGSSSNIDIEDDEAMEAEEPLSQPGFVPDLEARGEPAEQSGGISISYILHHLPSQPLPPHSLPHLQPGLPRAELKGESDQLGASGPSQAEMREWFISSTDEEEIIRAYLHKKFTKSRRQYLTQEVSDRGIMRKSVIVPNVSYREEEKKDEIKGIVDEGTSTMTENFALMKSLNARASESVEKNRLCVIQANFEEAWRSIDFGEEMVTGFILYCDHQQELPLKHWMIANKYFRWSSDRDNLPIFTFYILFRERFLKFVCGLELTDSISSRTLQSMFSRNLGKAQMMTYIYSFNLPSTEAIDFAYGANDILQWQVGTFRILKDFFHFTIFRQETPGSKEKNLLSCLRIFPCLPS